MRSFFKQALLSTLFVAMLSPAAFCADKKPAQQATQAVDTSVVARVNGKDITKEAFDATVNTLMPTMTFHTSISDRKRALLHKKALKSLIDKELIYTYAKDNNKAQLSEKDIDKKLEEVKKNLPEGVTIDDVLKNSHMDMAELREELKKNIIATRTAKDMSDELHKKADSTVTDAFMRDYYKNNLDKFKIPAQVRVRTILIKADPSGGVRVWNASRKRIDNVLATINQGMDFAEAAKEYSEDPYAQNGGDMGWAHKGSMMQEIDDAIKDLKVGEIAGPFTSLYGYHIAKLEGVKPSVQRKYEELNLKKLKKELQDKEYKRIWDEWIDGLHNAAKIEYIMPID